MDQGDPRAAPANAAYLNAVDQILHADWASTKLAHLALMREWIARLWPDGHPTKRTIQIAGTAGKGSVAMLLSAGLEASGPVGTMTSPHLFDFAERIRIDGRPARQDDIALAWEERVLPLAVDQARRDPAWPVTFHDAITLVALCLFEAHGCAFAVMETGLGGRYDQVTALEADLAILTNVGDDHAGRLGDQLWQRALDKAGIARHGVPLITGARGEALDVIASAANSAGAELKVVGAAEQDAMRGALGSRLDALPENALLAGAHQIGNAALTWAALEALTPDFERTAALDRWAALETPGRFTAVEPGVYIDTAHNVEETRALAAYVARRFPNRRIVLVLGLSGTRDPVSVLGPLVEIAGAVVVAAPPRYRGVPGETIEAAIRALTAGRERIEVVRVSAPGEALDRARALREGADDVILFTGSAYMIDQELNPDPRLRELSASWGWRYAPERGR